MLNMSLTNALNLLLILVISFPLHEFSHALVATVLGDSTPRLQGRLTLNPLVHLDLIGSLSMIFLGIGWAKPVETRFYIQGSDRYKFAITAFAGPLSNLLLAILLMFPMTFFRFQSFMVLSTFLYSFIQINCYLFVLNLIPIPPFDGYKIVQALRPNSAINLISNSPLISYAILGVLVYTGVIQKITLSLSNILVSFIR